MTKVARSLKESSCRKKKVIPKQEIRESKIKKPSLKEVFPPIWTDFEGKSLNLEFTVDKIISKELKISKYTSNIVPSPNGCSRIDSYVSHVKQKIWKDEKAKNRNVSRPFILISEQIVYQGSKNSDRHINFLFVSRSKIHLWGLFTSKPIKQHDLIVYYKGELVSNRVAFLREQIYIKNGIF